MLTMHNAGPQLFSCIVTFYARQNVSHSVTICDLSQKCHTLKITRENWDVQHIYMVSTFMGERLLLKNKLREFCLTEFALIGAVPILRHYFIDQICNFGQGSAHDSPKMEVCCKFDKSWHGNFSKFWLLHTKSILGLILTPKS